MEFQSDFAKISHLIQTEEINQIEFSEESVNPQFSSQGTGCSVQYGGENLDQYEQDIYNIFSKAREYRQRINNVQQKMYGGADDDAGDDTGIKKKKKREPNPTFLATINLAKVLRDSGKYPDIAFKHFIKIANTIWKSAKVESKSDDVEKINVVALRIAKNPDKFIEEFQKEQTAKQACINAVSFKSKNKMNTFY